LKYIRSVDAFIGRRSKVTIVVVCVALVAGLAVTDQYYGQNFSTALFYVIPILAGTWYVGRSAGMVIALLSGAGLLITDWALKRVGITP